MAGVDGIVLFDHPADHTGPRSINCYLVDAQDFAAINGKKYEIARSILLHSRQWLHNGTSADLHLQLAREPGELFDSLATSLLGALNRDDPDPLDGLRAH
jgi:hypothetical protein